MSSPNEPRALENARASGPDRDTEADGNEQPATLELDTDKLEELDRLRAAMGFIPEEAAKPQVIDERYRILRTLGHGGMGVVYLVHDEQLDSQVALKAIRESYLHQSTTAPDRLRQEARQMAQLRGHPHVVDVFEFGTHRGGAYLTMAYVEGSDLRAWARADGRTTRELLAAFLDAARGLLAAHERGIIHRDFKPENVLIDRAGRAKVTDFGIATAAHAPGLGSEDDPSDTLPQGMEARCTAPRGTVPYMPPEQMLGQPADGRTDQFSFCVALWEALAGALPYSWRSPSSQREALALPPRGREAIPPWLRAALLRGMSHQRGHRHASMAELITVLERGLERPRRIRRVSVLATVIALTAALGLGFGLLAREPSPEPLPTCPRFVDDVDDIWGVEQRAQLQRRGEELGADAAWARARLDALSAAWTTQARAACMGEQAPLPDDPERVCLERWLGPLDRAVELLVERGDRDTLDRAPDLLAALTPPHGDFCAFPGSPEDPELAELIDGARAAAVSGALDRARELSEQALQRAQSLSGEREYTAGLAHAHAARGEAAMFARDFETAAEHYRLAEAHAMGAGELQTLARVRVLWAKTQVFMDGEAARRSGREHLARSRPVFAAASLSKDTVLRGELLEVSGLLAEGQGRHDDAEANYTAAIAFFETIDNPLLAARATYNRGAFFRDSGALAKAEVDFLAAVAIYEGEGVPQSYPRLLDARFNLALAAYDRYFEVEGDERWSHYAKLSLTQLDLVIEHAGAPLQLKALGQACQVAADTEQLERARVLVPTALAQLAMAPKDGVDPATMDHVDVQVALAGLIADIPDGLPRARALIDRAGELDPGLRGALVQSFVEHLERTGGCDEAQRVLEQVSGLDDIDGFDDWAAQRPGQTCR